ncbi:MAG TPA: hypothetical protein VF145_01085 [Chitinophagaceae bacterium]
MQSQVFTPVTRTAIFSRHPFIDQVIAGFQRSYAADFDTANRNDRLRLKRYYDHLLPFNEHEQPTGYCVIACRAGTRREYLENFPFSLVSFLSALDIHQLYLTHFTATDILDEFRFENFHKKNLFRRMGAKKNRNLAWQFNTTDIPAVLPLFFFARVWDVPVVFLFSANEASPLSLHLCDDGNLHLEYPLEREQRIQSAAANSNFEVGGIEICSGYSTAYHRQAER